MSPTARCGKLSLQADTALHPKVMMVEEPERAERRSSNGSRVIPDAIKRHPRWLPWFLLYAEYGVTRVALADTSLTAHTFDIHGDGRAGRYLVAIGPVPCEQPETCPDPLGKGHATPHFIGNDLVEATRVFRRLEHSIYYLRVDDQDSI